MPSSLAPRIMRNLNSCSGVMLTLLIVGSLATVPEACAQTGSVGDSSEVETLKRQKAIAELRQAIAEARKAELEARHPASKTELLEGKTVVSGGLIEGQLLAFLAISEAAEMVARNLHGAYPNIKILVIHNERDANLISNYGVARLRIDALKSRYEKVLEAEKSALAATLHRRVAAAVPLAEGRPKSLPLVLGAATSAGGSLLDLLSLFRTDVNLEGQTLDIDDEGVLVGDIFQAIRRRYQDGIVLYYPIAISPNLESFQSSPLLAHLDSVQQLKDEAEELSRQIGDQHRMTSSQLAAVDDLRAETDDATLYDADRLVLQDDLLLLSGSIKNLGSISAQFDLLLKELFKIDEKSGLSLLTHYLRTENLVRAMNASPDESFWLTVSIIKAGGNQRIQRNLFLDLFRNGSKVTHNGGALVKYHLYDRNGVSRLSGTAQKYVGYLSSRDILKRRQ